MRLPAGGEKMIERLDYGLLFLVAVLLVFGTIMVFSSSVIMAEARWQAPYHFVVKHIIWVLIGTAAMMALANFDYRRLQRLARPLVVVTVILLVLVLVIGTVKGGARRWLQFGPISFQPSELAKLVMVIAFADYLDRKKSRMKHWRGLMAPLTIFGLLCGLIALEPDLGTPIIMSCVGFSLLYAGGARFTHILTLVLSVVPLVVIEILRKPYRLTRLRDYLASWGDIQSSSYQLNQSILALGSGGFFGKGLAQSQMKLLYLPEPHTDFIFPIVGEELGYAGTMVLITIFVLVVLRGWQISRQSQDYFGSILAVGITWLIAFQALLNMGVACGLLPTKGLPLPFVSFGGTALVFNLVGIGILLNISKRIYGRKTK
jgi:cell division protein FtsW